jgi:hypothetical protein
MNRQSFSIFQEIKFTDERLGPTVFYQIFNSILYGTIQGCGKAKAY